MDLEEWNQGFNRALQHTFVWRKCLLTFFTLLLCGVLVVFFRGLATLAGEWVMIALTFVPIFLCGGALFGAGILLVRIYCDECRNRPVEYWTTVRKSWDLMLVASYFSIPLVMAFLLLWMLQGVFFLIKGIPAVGEGVGILLSFAPFLLNLGALILCVVNVGVLFFVTPALALCGANRLKVSQVVFRRLSEDPFVNILLAFIALLPLMVVLGLLVGAALLTGSVYFEKGDSLVTAMQWFFIMIPFTALLAPSLIFFFQFSAEAHVMVQKQQRNAPKSA